MCGKRRRGEVRRSGRKGTEFWVGSYFICFFQGGCSRVGLGCTPSAGQAIRFGTVRSTVWSTALCLCRRRLGWRGQLRERERKKEANGKGPFPWDAWMSSLPPVGPASRGGSCCSKTVDFGSTRRPQHHDRNLCWLQPPPYLSHDRIFRAAKLWGSCAGWQI